LVSFVVKKNVVMSSMAVLTQALLPLVFAKTAAAAVPALALPPLVFAKTASSSATSAATTLLEAAADADVEVLVPPAVLGNAVSATVEGPGVLVFTALAVLDVDGDELLDPARVEVLVGSGVDVAMNPVVLDDVDASALVLTAVANDDMLLLNACVDGLELAVLVILEEVDDVNTSSTSSSATSAATTEVLTSSTSSSITSTASSNPSTQALSSSMSSLATAVSTSALASTSSSTTGFMATSIPVPTSTSTLAGSSSSSPSTSSGRNGIPEHCRGYKHFHVCICSSFEQ